MKSRQREQAELFILFIIALAGILLAEWAINMGGR